MTRVLITGGTGLIGKHLTHKLIERGYEVSVLSRSKRAIKNVKVFEWDIHRQYLEPEALDGVDFIIHLSGENIGDKRWIESRKKEIIDSRVMSGELLLREVGASGTLLQGFISSSAIGYYGAITTETIFEEDASPADDFLGEVCSKWEAAADGFQTVDVRTVKVRTGVVLTPTHGPLAKMVQPAKLGFASGLGSGKQYLPWIHIDDLCNIYIKAIEDERMNGPYNAVAPNHTNNTNFNRTLAKALNRPFWMPNVPSFILRMMFGEMADIFLNGSRISAEKIQKMGFHFEHPELEPALHNLLSSSA